MKMPFPEADNVSGLLSPHPPLRTKGNHIDKCLKQKIFRTEVQNISNWSKHNK